MKPTPTPEMIDAFIIAKESADRRLYGFHNLGRHFILDGTTEVWFTASDDYEVGHAAMMAQLERLRVDAALSTALSVPAAAVVGEPVAWVVPGDDNAMPNGFIDAMAWKEGEFTRPLYAAPSAPDGYVRGHLHLIRCFADDMTERNWEDKRLYIKQQVDFIVSALGGAHE